MTAKPLDALKLSTRIFYFLDNTLHGAENHIEDRLKRLIEGPDALPPGRALDVGTGRVRQAAYLAEHGWDVVGVEQNPMALKIARRRIAQRKLEPRIRLVEGPATQLATFVDGAFDLALDCMGPTSDLDLGRAQQVCRGIDERLKPGGTVLLCSWWEPEDVRSRTPAHWALVDVERCQPKDRFKASFYRFRKG